MSKKYENRIANTKIALIVKSIFIQLNILEIDFKSAFWDKNWLKSVKFVY